MTQTAELTVPYEVFQRERERRIQAEREQERLKFYEREYWRLHDIRHAPVIRPIAKDILEECLHVEKWGTVKAPDGSTRANYATIADKLHCDPGTVKREAERLEKLGLIDIHEHQGPKDERDRKYVHVKQERLATIGQLADPERVVPQQGGDRYICTKCDSRNVVLRKVTTTTLLCLDCHHESVLDPVDTGWTDKFGHKVQKAQKQPAFEKSKHTIHAEAEAEKQLAEHRTNNAPPIATCDGLSLESWLKQRIGHGRVIVSTGDLEYSKKYKTKKVGYIPDLAAYVRGDPEHIYGSRPALPDGTTYLLGFDCDTPELEKKYRYIMFRLALAGIASVCWKRRLGRFHLEVYLDRAVDRKAFYAFLLRICPDLAAIPECFPVGSDQNTGGQDRSDFPYSWPLWYRIGEQVYACAADFMFPDRPGELVSSPGIQSDRAGLTWLVAQAVTQAALIPALPAPAPEEGGALLESPLEVQPSGPYSDTEDLVPVVLAAINERLTWEGIAALCGGLRGDRFLSPTHDEDKPSVVIVSSRYASDFGCTPSGRPETRDKFGWLCAARGLDQTAELNRLITEYRHKGQVQV